MKEQLAAMTIIELVRTAHSYATSIQQIDTHSAIVREMASRLEALNLAHIGGMNAMRTAISERDQLVAENAALKKAEPAPFSKLMMEALDAYQSGADDVPELAMLSAYTKLRDGIKTPATDAWQREQMATAIRAALDECSDYLETDCVMDRLNISYEDAETRTYGAMELHDALVTVAKRLCNGEAV